MTTTETLEHCKEMVCGQGPGTFDIAVGGAPGEGDVNVMGPGGAILFSIPTGTMLPVPLGPIPLTLHYVKGPQGPNSVTVEITRLP